MDPALEGSRALSPMDPRMPRSKGGARLTARWAE
jgi:hypothetical protein